MSQSLEHERSHSTRARSLISVGEFCFQAFAWFLPRIKLEGSRGQMHGMLQTLPRDRQATRGEVGESIMIMPISRVLRIHATEFFCPVRKQFSLKC
jgi:hypothetical protein